jgi:heme-degrading monooxygenase HmoA
MKEMAREEGTKEMAAGNTITAGDGASFVAVNYISCEEHYLKEFERMFKTRAHVIDRMPGFVSMEVLKPNDASAYLIVSRRKDEAAFRQWVGSPEFIAGHQRGFEAIKAMQASGQAAPIRSDFRVYHILTD